MPKKIVIQIENQTQKAKRFKENTGSLSNDLMLFVKLDSYCFNNNILYIDQKFNKLSLNNNNNVFIKNIFAYIFRLNTISSILRILGIVKIIKLQKNSNPFENLGYITLIRGWIFETQCHLDSEKKDYYRAIFQNQFFRFHQNPFKTFKINTKGKILGVHIRRGDYINFLEGKYFFPDSTYFNYIKTLISLKYDFKTILIFSNEMNSINKNLFNFENLYFVTGNEYEDYFLMARCDLVVGPSSTFSMWANYIGIGKLLYIQSPNESEDKIKENLISIFES